MTITITQKKITQSLIIRQIFNAYSFLNRHIFPALENFPRFFLLFYFASDFIIGFKITS